MTERLPGVFFRHLDSANGPIAAKCIFLTNHKPGFSSIGQSQISKICTRGGQTGVARDLLPQTIPVCHGRQFRALLPTSHRNLRCLGAERKARAWGSDVPVVSVKCLATRRAQGTTGQSEDGGDAERILGSIHEETAVFRAER
ncbi:Hypp4396 [Branchiostoma lanceolatum]|uniref:Hypp4396 protein n=1 Tax=Branchiostoma lanceolatum TaxID=7740 RepID=A0A8K0EVU3_BRALA|nr:Hypp4396 [Branchiostoma lanceolatum]